jgi:serine protease Do
MRTLTSTALLPALITLLLATSQLLAHNAAYAASPPASRASSTQQTMDALTRANAAVVGVQVMAAEGARSIDTLGPRRIGSGVVIGADGTVLTIGYLLLEADTVQIITQDKKTVPARAVAYDQATGFGLLRPLVPLRGISPVTLGSASSINTGEALMASTGAQPNNEADANMTQLVSKRAFSGYWEYHIDSALFTSPPVENHSGAPLFNQRGELIGIGSLFVMDAMGQNQRLPGNMFVPVDLLKPIITELTETGSSKLSRRPWLGLTSSEQGGRVQIQRVSKESPAQTAGLQAGNVVLAIDDVKVATLEAFYKKLWDRSAPDTEVKLTVLQGAELKTIVLKPVDRASTYRKASGI